MTAAGRQPPAAWPDVSVDLVFEAQPPTTFQAADGTTTTARGAYLSGTRTRFHRVDQHGAFRILAVRLQPWVLTTHLGLEAGAFVNRFVEPPAALAALVTALREQSKVAQGDELPVGVVGSAAAAGSYGQLMNWWGVSANDGLGVSTNLVLGWLLATLVVSLWPLRPLAG